MLGMSITNDLQPLLVKPHEAARMLGISARTLWGLSAPRGPVPVVKISRSIRYDVLDLKRWIDHQKTQAVIA
jgi:hypothetical protein